MENLSYLLAAFAIVWAVVFGYVLSLLQKQRQLQRELNSLKETLMKKEFEGERNVLSARIQSLDETVKRQNEEISKLMRQLEKAATQVQDIAVKAVESSSHIKIIDKFHASMEEKRPREVDVKNKQ